MTDEQRKARLDIAKAELDDFCRLFGFGLRLEDFDGGQWHDTKSVALTYSRGGTVCDVIRVDPTRSYGRSYTKPYAVMEKMLNRLKNGPLLVWSWSESTPVEGGSLTKTYTRTYRLPKFSSVQELRILLMARCSEFADGRGVIE